jgi:hypothetical protein
LDDGGGGVLTATFFSYIIFMMLDGIGIMGLEEVGEWWMRGFVR